MQSLVQISIGGGRRGTHARAGRRPRSQRRRCSLRTRAEAAVVAEGVGGVETRPLARPPPEGNAKEVSRRRRRVTTAASRDDSVVVHVHGSLPAACGPWSRRTWPMEPSHMAHGASRLWPMDPSHMAMEASHITHGGVADGPWTRR